MTIHEYSMYNVKFQLHKTKLINSSKFAKNIMNINDLPIELLSTIFSYLTPSELLVLQNVSHNWREMIQNDKSLWNHLIFTTEDLDVKTSIDLVRQMPLLRSISIGNINSPNDMTQLINMLSMSCWDLREIKFSEQCHVHPSAIDLHNLCYYHPKISKFQIATKMKLTKEEICNIGEVLHEYDHLDCLTLCGLNWYQNCDLVLDILQKLIHLRKLKLPSIPGLKTHDLNKLEKFLPNLTHLTINISSLTGKNVRLNNLRNLKTLEIIENFNFSIDKMNMLRDLKCLVSVNINFNNCLKKIVLDFFKGPWTAFAQKLIITNCSFSDELVEILVVNCINVKKIIWLNPKDSSGEITDIGFQKIITSLKGLEWLELKTRSITKLYHSELGKLKGLRYVRINGMRVTGCP